MTDRPSGRIPPDPGARSPSGRLPPLDPARAPSGRRKSTERLARSSGGERSIELKSSLLESAKKRVAETMPEKGAVIEKAPEHVLTPPMPPPPAAPPKEMPPADATTPPSEEAPAPSAAGLKKPRKRPLRFKLLALGLSLVVATVLLEIVSHAVPESPRVKGKPLGLSAFCESLEYPTWRDPPALPYQLDPKLGFCLAPSIEVRSAFPEAPGGAYTIRTNALGLRDERVLAGEHPYRILAVGDSMTFGPGVEQDEAYPAQLQTYLGSELAVPLEVVNCGVCSWGQLEECAFLEHRAPDLAPSLVVLQFTPANDVLDDLRCKLKNGEIVPDPDVPRQLAQHWMFDLPFADTSHAWRLFAWHVGRHVVRYRLMQDPSRLARASDLIKRARDLTRAMNAKLVLVIAPTQVQVEASVTESILGTRKINDAIAARAKADGIPVLDDALVKALGRAHRTANRPYFAKDMHWNKEGHRVVAETISEWLKPQVRIR